MRIDKNEHFSNSANLSSIAILNKNTRLEGYNEIYENTDIRNSHIGLFTYIGKNSYLPSCRIGRFCSISWNVQVLIGEHPVEFVSTHPIFFSERKFSGKTFNSKISYSEIKYLYDNTHVQIGNDVLINAHVKIVCGVRIGDGSIIRAGAVVTKDVPPYTVVGGVPARVIRKRFSDEDIEFLTSFKWWEKDISWIENNVNYFDDIVRFRHTFEQTM